MSISILFGRTRDEYAFLSSMYPSPFTLGQQRWRTLEHFIQAMKTSNIQRRETIRNAPNAVMAQSLGEDSLLSPVRQDWNTPDTSERAMQIAREIQMDSLFVSDMILLQGLVAKYRSNPTLANTLLSTYPNTLIHENDSRNILGKLTMFIRDHMSKRDLSLTGDTDIIFDNLYSILESQGYTRIVSLKGDKVNIPLSEAPRESYTDLLIQGESLDTRGKNRVFEAIVDVFLDGGYTEDRLKTVLTRMNKYEHGRENISYFIITQLNKQNLNKYLRLSTYNNVKFFSPSELFVTPSKHMLTPYIEKIYPGSPIYNELRAMDTKLPELSSTDKLAKEKGLIPRDIIAVYDFSPHYRVIT